MKIKFNSKEITVDEPMTLQQLVTLNNIATEGIAVAVNRTVVPRSEYGKYRLADGDDVIVIKAFYGG